MEQLLCGYTLGLWLHRAYQPQVGHSLNLRLQRREMLRTWLGKAENKFASFLFSILHLHPCPRLSSVPQCTPSQVPPQLMPGLQRPPGDLPEPVRGSPPPHRAWERAGWNGLAPSLHPQASGSLVATVSGVEVGGKEGVCLAAGFSSGGVNLGDRKYNKTSPC